MRDVDMLPRCVRTHKITHPTEVSAREHIKVLYRSGKGNPDYAPYRCEVCGGFHVGHSRVRLGERVRKATRVGTAKNRALVKRRRK